MPTTTGTPGAEEVLSSIAEEARREVVAVLADAEAEAAALIEAARRSVEARVAAGLEIADAEARAEAARVVNEARLRLVHRRAELAARQLDEAFEAAARRLDVIASGGDPGRWARALEVLAHDGCERVGAGARVEVRPCDVGLLEPAVGPAVPVDGTLRDPGVRVCSADGRGEIDATLATRLARARSAIAEQVAAALGLGASGALPAPSPSRTPAPAPERVPARSPEA